MAIEWCPGERAWSARRAARTIFVLSTSILLITTPMSESFTVIDGFEHDGAPMLTPVTVEEFVRGHNSELLRQAGLRRVFCATRVSRHIDLSTVRVCRQRSLRRQQGTVPRLLPPRPAFCAGPVQLPVCQGRDTT